MACLLKSDAHAATALVVSLDGRKLHIASLYERFPCQSFLVEACSSGSSHRWILFVELWPSH